MGKHFAVGSVDALVSIWDVHELTCLRTFTRSDSQIRALAFSPDSSILAYASSDRMVFLDSVETGEVVQSIDSSFVDAVNDLAWHPKLNILAYCGDEPKGTRGE